MNYKSPELLYKHWLKQSEEDIKSVEILLQGGEIYLVSIYMSTGNRKMFEICICKK